MEVRRSQPATGMVPPIDPDSSHFHLLLETLPAGAYTCDPGG